MLIGIAIILSIPLIAMQFTNEVQWGLLDFLIAAILLSGTAVAIEVVTSWVKTKRTRILIITAIICGLLLVWAELAVGVFNSPIAGS